MSSVAFSDLTHGTISTDLLSFRRINGRVGLVFSVTASAVKTRDTPSLHDREAALTLQELFFSQLDLYVVKRLILYKDGDLLDQLVRLRDLFGYTLDHVFG